MIDRYKWRHFQEALLNYESSLNTIKRFNAEVKMIVNASEEEIKAMSPFVRCKKEMEIQNTDVSVRLFNILLSSCPLFKDNTGRTPVSALEKLSAKEFLSYKNAGKATLNELQELCYFAGIKMKP